MTATEPHDATERPAVDTPAAYTPGWGGQGMVRRDEQTLRDLLRGVARRRVLLASVSLGVLAAVSAWAFVATPRYRSDARLRIETKTQSSLGGLADQATSLPGAGGLIGGFTRDELETEIGVLRSDRIADAMVDSLALGIRVTSPAASRASVLVAHVVDPAVDADGKITLTRQADGRYHVEQEKFDPALNLPPTIAPGDSILVGGTSVVLSPRLRPGGPAAIKLRVLPRYEVHKLLEKRLLIARQEGGSRLVEVSFEDPDRALAAQVVSRIVTEFVTYTNGTEQADDTTEVIKLRQQVDGTSRRLNGAESALRVFEEQSRLIAPEEQASAQVKRISTISGHVDAITVERNALQRVLTLIEQRARGGADVAAYRQLATFPSLITNRAIQDLLQSLVDLENKRSALGVRRTDANDEYKQLTDRIGEIERQLYQLGPQYLESLDQQLATTVRTVTALADTLDAMPAAAMQCGRLVRDRTVLEAAYIALQKQLKQAELRDVLRTNRVRVVDAPRPANPDDPVFPRKAVMIALGTILGLALAVALALFAELWREPA